MLGPADLPEYLITRGLLSKDCVFRGDLSIQVASRRNKNFIVKTQTEGLFVKQGDSTQHGDLTVAAEASLYQLCEALPSLATVKSDLPRAIHFDPQKTILILEFLTNATNSNAVFTSLSSQHLVQFGQSLGRTLARIHEVSIVGYDDSAFLRTRYPWIFTLNAPASEVLDILSPASQSVLKIAQESSIIRDRIYELATAWAAICLVHGDLKFEHVLLSKRPNLPPKPYIIDWEMVQLGDPAWDVAGILQDVIALWLAPFDDDILAGDVFVNSISERLRSLHPFTSSFFNSYILARSCTHRTDFLHRTTLYAGLRLIQLAFEVSQHVQVTSTRAIVFMQVAENVLANPELARSELFSL